MDFLKTKLAPVTDKAFEEIKEVATEILKTKLTARKFVDFTVKGLDYAAEPVGRLNVSKGKKYGIHKVQPLVEAREPFELDIWELDNIERGAKDIELGPLEDAARNMAEFEENAIYNGFKEADITGLLAAAEHKPITFDKTDQSFVAALNQAVNQFVKLGIGGPYMLVINPDVWQDLLAQSTKGYPLKRQVNENVGDIIFSPSVKEAVVVSARGGDFELIVGQDFAIGYLSHTSEKVKLYLTESFTFRVLDPNAVIPLKSRSE